MRTVEYRQQRRTRQRAARRRRTRGCRRQPRRLDRPPRTEHTCACRGAVGSPRVLCIHRVGAPEHNSSHPSQTLGSQRRRPLQREVVVTAGCAESRFGWSVSSAPSTWIEPLFREPGKTARASPWTPVAGTLRLSNDTSRARPRPGPKRQYMIVASPLIVQLFHRPGLRCHPTNGTAALVCRVAAADRTQWCYPFPP